MLRSDEEWLALVDQFYSAAVSGEWYGALEELARLTGSKGGQLIGVGGDKTVPFNLATGMEPGWFDAFLAIGGADPAINPVVRHGSSIDELTILQSAEFLSVEERRNDFFMNEHAACFDIPHVCLTPLVKNSDGLIGLAVMRGEREGEIERHQRDLFTAAAPHIRTAVRMQMSLDHQGAQLMAGALEAMGQAVFICNRQGLVRAMTARAEALVGQGGLLKLSRGQLGCVHRNEGQALARAIMHVAVPAMVSDAPRAIALVVHGPKGNAVMLDILPLPRREASFGFEARVLVVVHNGEGSDGGRVKGVLQSVHGLTAAEAEVALMLAQGGSPEAVARLRKTSVSTVRTQMRAIYAKIGVHRQNELASLVASLRA